MKKIFVLGSAMVLLLITACQVEKTEKQQEVESVKEDVSTKQFKVLHVMSYHSPWEWTDDQFNGFKDALKQINVEYKVFQMDTKRKSSEAWKERIGKEARDVIDAWKPDLVYTSDDNAQIYVTKYYVNKDIPFVFSGVNAKPERYGYVGSSNIAGVLEIEHSAQTLNLLKQIDPDIKRIAVITDNTATFLAVMRRLKAMAGSDLGAFDFIRWDVVDTYARYQKKIKEYQDQADAIVHLGVFSFKDEMGNNVPYEEVMEWTVGNSKLPDCSFWEDRVVRGNLASVTVSGYAQGKAAGEIANGILAEGKSPSDFGFKPTVRGRPIVSLARAKKLGITIKSDVLLGAQVVEKFLWEE